MSVACRLLPIALLAATIIGPAVAADFTAGTLRIADPWSRAVPDGAKAAGGFMTLTNTGNAPDTLIGGTTVIAQRFEVHEMSVTDGVMRMRELKPGLVIAPGATVVLKPGSYHVMFLDLKQQPKAGQSFKGTLEFEKAGKVEVEFAVEPLGARAPGGKAGGSGSGSGSGSGAPRKPQAP